MARRRQGTNLPAPFLRRVSMIPDRLPDKRSYPFSLPWLGPEFELEFEEPVTIIVGENGTGKSTLVEALAANAGFGRAGGNRDHGAADGGGGIEADGAVLSEALRIGWLPKVTYGWFFRAESFFSVARYLDDVSSPSADFLSHSHGEGFLRLFSERLDRQGVFFLDEPESALSPRRQVELLRWLAEVQQTAHAQVIMATHSPILMAVPGATLLQVSRGGFRQVSIEETAHFRLYRTFCADPDGFARSAIDGDVDQLF